jgi:hypothetical protein
VLEGLETTANIVLQKGILSKENWLQGHITVKNYIKVRDAQLRYKMSDTLQASVVIMSDTKYEYSL